jgi:chemotaxis protein methyltransferase CheR/two-component system CheB/CheR fusion protein
MDALPTLLRARPPDQPVRAWVAGCSTGEEAYTLAILLREALGAATPPIQTVPQIFATDLDVDAIARARIGVYPPTIAEEMSAERLAANFTPCAGGFRVARAIRESVVFAPHDVLIEPPFTKLDLLTCRNLLIYLSTELQQQVLATFHYSLRTGGLLLLGSAETVGPATSLFTTLDAKARLYRRLDSGGATRTLTFPVPIIRPPPVLPLTPNPSSDLQTAAEKLLRDRFAPAAVLADDNGDIVYVSGRTGRFLEAAAGKANWNVFAMAREGLRHELVDAFRQATLREEPVIRHGVAVGAPPASITITLTVQRITAPPALEGLIIVVFTEVAAPLPAALVAPAAGSGPQHGQLAALREEVAELRLALAAVHEEKRETLEERNAAHEELQSANEELQSTNEELTTSKEETQSMNEELQTLNHELQTKVDDLSRVSDDMKNLLEHTEIAAVFLDGALCVRLFTAGSNRMFPLRDADIGRPITDFSFALTYPTLADDAREVLRTLVVHERSFAAPDGRWSLVRMMPYRTLDNRVDGVAITFTDISASKALEEQLRATQVGLEQHITEQDQRIADAEGRRPT